MYHQKKICFTLGLRTALIPNFNLVHCELFLPLECSFKFLTPFDLCFKAVFNYCRVFACHILILTSVSWVNQFIYMPQIYVQLFIRVTQFANKTPLVNRQTWLDLNYDSLLIVCCYCIHLQ